MNQRIANLRIAIIYFFASAAIIVFSFFIFYSSTQQKEKALSAILKTQCLNEFGTYGLKANANANGKINFSKDGTENMQETVVVSSVVIGRCVGYELTEFCAGIDCQNPGISFSLSPI